MVVPFKQLIFFPDLLFLASNFHAKIQILHSLWILLIHQLVEVSVVWQFTTLLKNNWYICE